MATKKDFLILSTIAMFFIIFMYIFGRELSALWISIVCAYLLKHPYQFLVSKKVPKILACGLLVSGFLVFFVFLILVIIPPVVDQAYNFLNSLPEILSENQARITSFIDNITSKVPSETISSLIKNSKLYLTSKSTDGVLFIINLLPVTFEISLYFILVPIMMFFLLRDSSLFAGYLLSFVPTKSNYLNSFWLQLDEKLGSYLQGKVIEMLLVGIVSAIIYSLAGIEYSLLMAGLMAFSVLIPVVGAIIATLPVLFIGIWQFGIDSNAFLYLILAHLSLIIIDGNILVPILFSEKLNLHPLVILIGILIFGALFGFWGLFFAIPLLIVLSMFLESFKVAFILGSKYE